MKAKDICIKILLVDDEVNITKALRRLLQQVDGYEVLTAESGPEALSLLEKNPDIGVIVSDQRMPVMTGVEFLMQARELMPDAIRILLTGYADITASIDAINRGGVFRYLTKPWQDENLLKIIAEAAHSFWLVEENKRLNDLVAKQNEELQNWNVRLKQRVLDQTAQIRTKSDALAESNVELRQSFTQIIDALSGLIEMRDRLAPGHCRNVAKLVKAMAEKLGLAEEEQGKIHAAGLLHDIGKIALSDALVGKESSELNGREVREYQSHAVRGQTAIDMVPALRDIGVLIRHHHEHFDGTGFPDRLEGNDIPLGSRLICVADMFERRLGKFAPEDAFDSAMNDLSKHWGSSLDPGLQGILAEGAKDVFSYLHISKDVKVANISPKELREGMQLYNDLYSGTGVLLLNKGAVLNRTEIDSVKRCFKNDPFERKISVFVDQS